MFCAGRTAYRCSYLEMLIIVKALSYEWHATIASGSDLFLQSELPFSLMNRYLYNIYTVKTRFGNSKSYEYTRHTRLRIYLQQPQHENMQIIDCVPEHICYQAMQVSQTLLFMVSISNCTRKQFSSGEKSLSSVMQMCP